jgi:negative regulator of sigma-B (phosphoserine phosphatase)
MRGESDSGDQHVVQEVASGTVLAVVDGIGHGPEARDAARRATEVVAKHGARGAVALLRLCHEALIGTRGVVMSIASVDLREDTVTWLGVGNVTGVLVRADQRAVPPREEMFVRAGVVGMQLPLLQASVLSIAPGDVLVMATDGIRPDFRDALNSRVSPLRLAERVFTEHGRGTDDALVMAARYVGRAPASGGTAREAT